MSRTRASILVFAAVISYSPAHSQDAAPILFTNVNVFDGENEALIENANVVVTGNTIFRPEVTFSNT